MEVTLKENRNSYKLFLTNLLDNYKEKHNLERFILIKSYYDEEEVRIPFSEFLCSSNCREDELKLILSDIDYGYTDLLFKIQSNVIYLDGKEVKFYEESGDLVIQSVTPCYVTTFEIEKDSYTTAIL